MINLTLGVESSSTFTWGRRACGDSRIRPRQAARADSRRVWIVRPPLHARFPEWPRGGTAAHKGRWHEPLTVNLGPGSEAHDFVRFGQTNLIAVQLSEFVTRPAHLDELDPVHGRSLPGSLSWPFSPAQFEQYLTIGPPPESVAWGPAHLVAKKDGPSGEAVFELTSDVHSLSALVTYRWEAQEPVLHKFVEITNRGAGPVRILNVRLGNYQTAHQCQTASRDSLSTSSKISLSV